MKTKLLFTVLIAAQLRISAAGERAHTEDFVVHEWGTFTSVQGADGIPMEWNPLITAELPSFVYDLNKPSGEPRRSVAQLFGTKSAFRTLQRMETPVLYFYSGQERTVDLTVKFPEGRITEWFPQARDVGPSSVQPRPLLAKADQLAAQAGLSGVNFSSLDTKKSIAESLLRWTDVKVFPAKEPDNLTRLMPSDASGGHYYAARETDADLLRVDARVNGETKPEYEKFLFYRGVGNFKTPLQVTLSGDEEHVSLRNAGGESLHHLLVLNVRHGQGKFVYLDHLPAGSNTTVKLDPDKNSIPLSELVEQISKTLHTALAQQGLYEREAAAMVKTWRDSWFEEQGVRVLYVLPRDWTDRLLPITIEPKPRQLVRVIVGRAEMITPRMEWELMKQIARYSDADEAARKQIIEDTRKLGFGRFAEATTRRLASKISNREFNRLSWELLEAVSKPEPRAKVLAQK